MWTNIEVSKVLKVGMRTIDRVKKRFVEEGLESCLRRKPTTRIYDKKVDGDADNYQGAKKITLVMDNLNTHKAGSFYEIFSPEKAKQLWDRFEFVFTPKHGSWLNIAEIELNVLNRQCLNRRIDTIEKVRNEVEAWGNYRNNKKAKNKLEVYN